MMMCVKSTNFLCYFLVIGIAVTTASNSPACFDEEGNTVDWFIAYKFPELSNQPEPFSTGYSYAFINSASINSKHPSSLRNQESLLDINSWLNRFVSFSAGNQRHKSQNETVKRISKNDDDLHWILSKNLITDPKSIVLRSLEIAYSIPKNTFIQSAGKISTVFYNDGPPENLSEETKKKSRRAHAKGVVIMDDIRGDSIWLTHSTPQFPPQRGMKLEFNENSRKFGQTFMCISYNLRQSGKQIINHLVNMNPLVYDYQVSDRLKILIPEIRELEITDDRRRRAKDGISKLAQRIKTKEGQDILIYSKSSSFDEDLYSGWMDSELKTTLYVETWRNGAGTPLNSTCPRDNYQVNNVSELKVKENQNKQVTWSYHSDHSKWAISDTKESGIVCISDINRMKSQFKRGGGAACIKCPNCWSVFSNTILDLEPCPKG